VNATSKLQRSIKKPFTFNTNKVISLRIYPDNRPQNMEIAALQKGLVLIVNGSEVIEEGAGFGVPIAKYSDRTYFSRTATVYVGVQNEYVAEITKVFLLDSVSKKQVHGAFINDGLYSAFHKTFEKSYIQRGKMRPFFDWIMRFRKMIGIKTYFSQVSPRGKITVNYLCYSDHIKVSADFSQVDMTGCPALLILNEQGATFFRKCKSDNEVLQDRKIGAWTKVNAGKAELSDLGENISFSLEKRDDADLYSGREQVKDRFSWAGMTYALNPNTRVFNYIIQLQENKP